MFTAAWFFLKPLPLVEKTPKKFFASLAEEQLQASLPPPEIQQHYLYGMSTLRADSEVVCVYLPKRRVLNCPEIVHVVDRQPIELSMQEVRERASIAQLVAINDSLSLNLDISQKRSSIVSDDLARELTGIQPSITTTSDGTTYLASNAMPVRSPFIDEKSGYICKTTRWLTLKAKRAAGC